MNQLSKDKFRRSKTWKDFRLSQLTDKNFTCELCSNIYKGKKSRTLHIHHKDLNPTNYTNISDPTRFAVLCSSCHDIVHFAHTRTKNKKKPCADSDLKSIAARFIL